MKTFVPATCGEWVQGYMYGEAVLISCPIELYSFASATPSMTHKMEIEPPDCRKALAAVEKIMPENKAQTMFKISIESQIPVAKGFGSSTADITGACAALSYACGNIALPGELSQIACSIEPSDCTMFPGWNLFTYRSGRWNRYLGEAIRLPLIILDPGEEIDTITYNTLLDMEKLKGLEKETIDAVEQFKLGVQEKSASTLGKAARISALYYQKILYSELVETTNRWADRLSACGVIRAHSGGITGLLFEDEGPVAHAMKWLENQFSGDLIYTHTTGGGVRYEVCQK